MAGSTSRLALWPILFFFLIGAAAAILWDLRKPSTPPKEDSTPPAPAPAPRERARIAAQVRPAEKHRERQDPEPDRAPARARKQERSFERVGIPSDRREDGGSVASGELSEAQAQRILKRLVESRQYYGISPDCLWTRPLGYRNGSHEFEIVAADCESIARGSVIATWRVDATTGEASFRNAQGAYEPAP